MSNKLEVQMYINILQLYAHFHVILQFVIVPTNIFSTDSTSIYGFVHLVSICLDINAPLSSCGIFSPLMNLNTTPLLW